MYDNTTHTYLRDNNTTALLNADVNAYMQRKMQKKNINSINRELMMLKKNLQELTDDLNEMKQMVSDIYLNKHRQ